MCSLQTISITDIFYQYSVAHFFPHSLFIVIFPRSNSRRLLSYMHRHLPQKPEPRYWITGNYIFDYRVSKFGIGAMLQAFLVGDSKSDLPVVAYLKFDTEALGKFTGQLAVG